MLSSATRHGASRARDYRRRRPAAAPAGGAVESFRDEREAPSPQSHNRWMNSTAWRLARRPEPVFRRLNKLSQPCSAASRWVETRAHASCRAARASGRRGALADLVLAGLFGLELSSSASRERLRRGEAEPSQSILRERGMCGEGGGAACRGAADHGESRRCCVALRGATSAQRGAAVVARALCAPSWAAPLAVFRRGSSSQPATQGLGPAEITSHDAGQEVRYGVNKPSVSSLETN